MPSYVSAALVALILMTSGCASLKPVCAPARQDYEEQVCRPVPIQDQVAARITAVNQKINDCKTFPAYAAGYVIGKVAAIAYNKIQSK